MNAAVPPPPGVQDLRAATLAAALCAGVTVLLSTEVLSWIGRLTAGSLLTVWALAALGGALAWARLGAPTLARRPARAAAGGRHPIDRIMVVSVAVTVVATGALAVCGVPTTWDAMSYHLARVAHWAANQSVAFYPTHVVRQLYQPPLAEYAVLQLLMVTGGDRLANLVQWAAMVGSLVAVSMIARQLGAERRGQLLSVLVCATIPMGILQASTTQNDYVLALWLGCLTSALLRPAWSGAGWRVLGAGVSLGLACSTKGTAYVLAAPLVIVFTLTSDGTVRRRFGQGLAMAAIALAMNAPQYARNAALFGNPLGPGGEGPYRYANEEFSVRILASNALRNAALQFGTPVPAVNGAIEHAVALAHRLLGVPVDDPRSTWPDTAFRVPRPVAQEDEAGNGLHLVLVAAALPAAWRRGGGSRALALALILGFALFCLVLRWQPWHSRLLLPLFVLSAPLVGCGLERLRTRWLAALFVPLALSTLYFVTQNRAHPLWGRNSIFTMSWSEQRTMHAGGARAGATRRVVAAGCRDVGLALGGNDQEYFYWSLLSDAHWAAVIYPVLVANVSAALHIPPRAHGTPCLIIREGAPESQGDLKVGGVVYRAVWRDGDVQLLVPADSARATSPSPAASVLLDRGRVRQSGRV